MILMGMVGPGRGSDTGVKPRGKYGVARCPIMLQQKQSMFSSDLVLERFLDSMPTRPFCSHLYMYPVSNTSVPTSVLAVGPKAAEFYERLGPTIDGQNVPHACKPLETRDAATHSGTTMMRSTIKFILADQLCFLKYL